MMICCPVCGKAFPVEAKIVQVDKTSSQITVRFWDKRIDHQCDETC